MGCVFDKHLAYHNDLVISNTPPDCLGPQEYGLIQYECGHQSYLPPSISNDLAQGQQQLNYEQLQLMCFELQRELHTLYADYASETRKNSQMQQRCSVFQSFTLANQKISELQAKQLIWSEKELKKVVALLNHVQYQNTIHNEQILRLQVLLQEKLNELKHKDELISFLSVASTRKS